MGVSVLCVILMALFEPSMTGSSVRNVEYKLDSWMGSLYPHLKHKKLNEIAIPGTHNSGSYPISIGSRTTGDIIDLSHLSDFEESIPAIVDLLSMVGPRWSKSQELSIFDQLKMGIRYLDLRVYCDEETDEYYLEHSFIGSNLTDELLHIAQFVEEHTKEVVILDMMSVQNCSENKVVSLLERFGKVFGDKLAHLPTATKRKKKERKKNKKSHSLPTYSQLVKKRTTVFVALRKEFISKRFDWLWNSDKFTISPFANTESKEKLRIFIADKMSESRSPKSLFVSQIILTPTTQNVFASLFGSGAKSLQEMAVDLNKDFIDWVEDFSQLNPNIFITDFPDRGLVKKIINMNL
ncbi:PI-PLC X domain-containing protein 2-like [Bolinopsis microptera]|uniref:PI-PLC X domain-containing protein 2-like n=1 Tax=Bolinopsis microptera TaxID=2820187 RepID=UPI00307A441B